MTLCCGFNYLYYYKKVILKNYQRLNNSDLNIFSLSNYLLQNTEQYIRQYYLMMKISVIYSDI